MNNGVHWSGPKWADGWVGFPGARVRYPRLDVSTLMEYNAIGFAKGSAGKTGDKVASGRLAARFDSLG